MNRKRTSRKWIWLFAIIAGIWLFQKMNLLPSWKDIFSSKPVIIDETPILIKEIKSLGEIITATLYDEVVVDSTIKRSFPQLPLTDDKIVIIARGKVLAGINMKDITDNNVRVSGDTAWMKLPPVKFLDVIINPGDYETFEETGKWQPDAVTAVKVKAKALISQHAYNKQLLNVATNKAKAVIQNFLNAAGFKVVYFN